MDKKYHLWYQLLQSISVFTLLIASRLGQGVAGIWAWQIGELDRQLTDRPERNISSVQPDKVSYINRCFWEVFVDHSDVWLFLSDVCPQTEGGYLFLSVTKLFAGLHIFQKTSFSFSVFVLSAAALHLNYLFNVYPFRLWWLLTLPAVITCQSVNKGKQDKGTCTKSLSLMCSALIAILDDLYRILKEAAQNKLWPVNFLIILLLLWICSCR